jgi:transcriptional regulator with XRE-family HTH domain
MSPWARGVTVAGNKAFGDRVRELREAKLRTDPRFTLRQFAKMVDVSPTFLSKMERGEFDPPRAEKIIKIAELLGVDADELLALAHKVDPEVEKIIREQPKMADFLRTAREKGLTPEDLNRLIEKKRG